MTKSLYKILFLFVFVSAYAQNLDSLFLCYTNALEISSKLNTVTDNEKNIIKCGLSIVHALQTNFDKLTPSQQDKISSLLNRPETDESLVSPTGYFKIHYNTSGIHEAFYDLNEFAEALDSVYKFEINLLGYPVPPSDGSEGGDDKYDVYIQDLGSIYGYTDFTSSEKSPSFMVVDNDFNIHYTTGINGAKVTAAHEFHHAIQVGSYKYRSEDSFFYEMLSTSMEEFVFDSINDYYDYINSYYQNAQAPFYATYGSGYDLAIWNIFLQKKYGYDVIKRSLENIVSYPALESIAGSLIEYGGSFKKDFAEFGVWNYFTGSRSKEDKYFEEAEFYPFIKPLMSFSFTSSTKSVKVNSNPSSNNYIKYVDISRGLPDTLVSIITNSDIQTTSRTELDYTVYKYNEEGSTEINDLYWSELSSNNKSIFAETVIFNNELAFEAKTEREDIDFSYPQPFDYNKHTYVYIPVAADISGRAYLNVYTTAMDLVFSDEKNIFATDKIVVRWDGKKSNGNKLPTGIYIYVTKGGDTIKKGKIVIYNE